MPTTPAAFDPEAQHDRELALPAFLDLNLSQWEASLLTASDDCPGDLEPFAVAVIEALRAQAADPDARGDYLQAIAAMATSSLRYFIDRVGRH